MSNVENVMVPRLPKGSVACANLKHMFAGVGAVFGGMMGLAAGVIVHGETYKPLRRGMWAAGGAVVGAGALYIYAAQQVTCTFAAPSASDADP